MKQTLEKIEQIKELELMDLYGESAAVEEQVTEKMAKKSRIAGVAGTSKRKKMAITKKKVVIKR